MIIKWLKKDMIKGGWNKWPSQIKNRPSPPTPTVLRNKNMKRVILESPYAGDIKKNVAYARKAMKDCLYRGEAPIASHLLYPQVLDDSDPDERSMGIDAGLAWGHEAEMTVVYMDLGISKGMKYGIERAEMENRLIEFRSLGENDDT